MNTDATVVVTDLGIGFASAVALVVAIDVTARYCCCR